MVVSEREREFKLVRRGKRFSRDLTWYTSPWIKDKEMV